MFSNFWPIQYYYNPPITDSASSGDTAPFSWLLVCTRVCLCPPRVCFPSSVEVLESNPTSFQSQFCGGSHLLGSSMVGLLATSSKRAYATSCVTQVCCSQSPCLCSRQLLTCASSGDTQTFKAGLAQSLWGLWVLVHQRFCLRTLMVVNTKIRLIIFFADKDGEALHSQQKQDQELWLRS